MKNLPEEEMFKDLESRLRAYAEKPDDGLWEKIAGNVAPVREPAWIKSTNRTALAISVALFLMLIYLSTGTKINPADAAFTEITKSIEANNNKTNDKTLIKEERGKTISKETADGAELITTTSKNDRTHKPKSSPSKINKTNDNVAVLKVSKSISDKKKIENSSDAELASAADVKKSDDELLTTSQRQQANINNIQITKNEPAYIQQTDSLTVDSLVVARMVTTEATESREEEKKKKKKPAIYVSALPSFAYHRMIPGQHDATVISKINSPSILSPKRLGISLEGGIQVALTKKLDVFGGVFFYYQHQTIRYSYLSDENVILEPIDDGYTVTPASAEREVNYTMLNAGAQAGFLYTLKKKGPLSHKVGSAIGYQTGLLKGSGADTYFNSESSYLSYLVLYRNEYAINKKASVFIQPTFNNVFWSSEKLDEPFSLKSYKAGITFGVIFTLD